jgi:hypothetical protein
LALVRRYCTTFCTCSRMSAIPSVTKMVVKAGALWQMRQMLLPC